MAKRILIEPGTRFGSLVVVKPVEDYVGPQGTKAPRYLCRCDCGNEYITRGSWLICGKSVRCVDCSRKAQSKNKIKDLTGQKFGRWTVLSQSKKKSGNNQMWVCRCACGTIKEIRGSSLTSGNSTSCGCYALEKLREDHLIDLTGRVFSRLTVISQVDDFISPINGKRRSRWKCLCSCGNFVEVNGSDLTSGNTHSCGCYKLDATSESHFVDLTGQRFGMLTIIKLPCLTRRHHE